jgi:hypothetical protein
MRIMTSFSATPMAIFSNEQLIPVMVLALESAEMGSDRLSDFKSTEFVMEVESLRKFAEDIQSSLTHLEKKAKDLNYEPQSPPKDEDAGEELSEEQIAKALLANVQPLGQKGH